ncbi:unnamed protein product, partial [Ixodes pacificus]
MRPSARHPLLHCVSQHMMCSGCDLCGKMAIRTRAEPHQTAKMAETSPLKKKRMYEGTPIVNLVH